MTLSDNAYGGDEYSDDDYDNEDDDYDNEDDDENGDGDCNKYFAGSMPTSNCKQPSLNSSDSNAWMPGLSSSSSSSSSSW